MKNTANQDFLPLNPKKLISLWDMISFTSRFLNFWISLNSFKDSTGDEINQKGDSACADEQFRGQLSSVLQNLKGDCEKLQLDAIVKRIDHFLITLIAPLHCRIISSEIHALLIAISTEVVGLKFAFIPKDYEVFFEAENLFGSSVNDAFPSARPHIKDAGNCLAADLNTAAVFHLMISAEFGL